MEKIEIKCETCPRVFTHFRSKRGVKKRFCNFCLRRRNAKSNRARYKPVK